MTTPPDATALAGTRLDTVELYNWGTFHQKIARFDLGGGNALLTGNMGAGKSTLADAITSVLVAQNKVIYNAAAGADRDERSLRSYALGQWSKVTDETPRPYLRSADGCVSVVLCRFARMDTDEQEHCVTAGLILTFRAGGGRDATTPVRTYFLAENALSVSDLLAHSDLRSIRSVIKTSGGNSWEDNFAAYQREAVKALRVTKQGLATFAQTVSMKQVGNLTGFVREHMLDAVDMTDAVDTMLTHYADLTEAHDNVVDIRKQLEVLDRVAAVSERYERTEARIAAADMAREGLTQYANNLRYDLLTTVIEDTERVLPEVRARLAELDRQIGEAKVREMDLSVQINSVGGADLSTAETALRDAKQRVDAVIQAREQIRALAVTAKVTAPDDVSEFGRFRAELETAAEQVADEDKALGEEKYAAFSAIAAAKKEIADTETDLAAAKDSNIPAPLLQLRTRLAEDVGVDTQSLPFAGELMAVTDPLWESATERLVRSLALSLLVPHADMPKVAAWIDTHDLRMRLVAHDVTDPGSVTTPRAGTLATVLQVKPNTLHSRWLTAEIARRYTHTLVVDGRDLTAHQRAITPAGQIRDGNQHTKDDRPGMTDRRTFVLGWDTAARRAHLAALIPQLRQKLGQAEAATDGLAGRDTALRDRQFAVRMLTEQYTDPTAIDLEAAEAVRRQTQKHRDALAADPEIAKLRQMLVDAQEQRNGWEGDQTEAQREVWDYERTVKQATEQRSRLVPRETDLVDEALTLWQETLADAQEPPVAVEEVTDWERAVRASLDKRIDSANATRDRSGRDLTSVMHEFVTGWPQHCIEIVVSDVTSRVPLLERRRVLATDDLPKWETSFKERLERNVINEIALFSHKLNTQAEQITSRLDLINDALSSVEYHHGTYIRLEKAPTSDVVVSAFRTELSEITAGALGGDDAYAEERFLRVRDLLDRFTGREGSSERDRAWAAKVTDVRQWSTFVAAERNRDTDEVIERYADSDGKSGGQKEKLAYTILAASLAYQYGLAEGRQDTFRLVMIDEAFGRGPDESARFALDMFTALGLQVLVITPLQKVHTIAPYVDAVGFVQRSETGSRQDSRSQLLSMTIEKFNEALRSGASATGTS